MVQCFALQSVEGGAIALRIPRARLITVYNRATRMSRFALNAAALAGLMLGIRFVYLIPPPASHSRMQMRARGTTSGKGIPVGYREYDDIQTPRFCP